MIFLESDIKGAYCIDVERKEDERGFFARCWCRKELEAHGLCPDLVQINLGYSRKRGTLRGLHFQVEPHGDLKISRCTRGAVYDVAVDLRPDSPTYQRWVGVELSEENRRMLYVPAGCAHGYLTLTDDTELYYLTSAYFAPDHARGVRYDDTAFNIKWPTAVSVISAADRSWPDYSAR